MMLESKIQPSTITDFSGFQSLKNAAEHHDPKATKAVAKQFEALFLQMMLKEMRKASGSLGDTLLKNDEEEYFTELFDKQIALQMANGRGMGLAAVIEKQLMKQTPSEVLQQTTTDIRDMPATTINKRRVNVAPPINTSQLKLRHSEFPSPEGRRCPARADEGQTLNDVDLNAAFSFTMGIDTIVKNNTEKKPSLIDAFNFNSPDEFIKKLMPLAKEFAKKIGVKPELLIAQAALETGWGKSIHEKSFNNLFGIKSTPDWQGKSVTKNTLEFENGILHKKGAPFRAYDTIRDSFADYVNFITGNQRYQEALKNAHNPQAFAHALQEAGYATDPDYAKKILQIYEKIG